jgi:hypothetical protein
MAETIAAPIEPAPADEAVEEDAFATSDFDAQSTASTSVTSSVYQHSFENGRRVRHFRFLVLRP